MVRINAESSEYGHSPPQIVATPPASVCNVPKTKIMKLSISFNMLLSIAVDKIKIVTPPTFCSPF